MRYWETDHRPGYVDQREYLWTDDPIVDIPALSFVLDQPGITKYGKLLRDVSLPIAQTVLDVANTFLTVS
jgi:hypothetical protein